MSAKRKKTSAIHMDSALANSAEQVKMRSAHMMLPVWNGALVVDSFAKFTFSKVDLGVLVGGLQEECDKLHDGDLQRCCSILLAQAHGLDSIFTHLSSRAARSDHLVQLETMLRLALKAQSQCRATIETLAQVKNGPVVFAKQANISHGHQQVNNCADAHIARVGKEIPPNELLESDHGQRLDTQAPSATSPIGSNVVPWQKSTGPKSAVGKARASQNRYRGGTRPMLRAISRMLRNQKTSLNDLT
jgi:hypothetical protein